jgi:hypothetical protein
MFFGCNKIKSIDLSKFTFDITIIKGVNNGILGMISNCSSLISIDLSNYNNQNIDLSSILEDNKGHSNLIYINLYNTKLSLDKFSNFTTKRLSYAMSKTLYICMEGDAFSNCNGDFCEILKSLVKICCISKTNICGGITADNYITVNYNNKFSYGLSQFFNLYNSRNNLERIFLGDTQKGIGDPLEITSSSTLKIYFDSSIESLSSFFNSYFDTNCKYIKSVDFFKFLC